MTFLKYLCLLILPLLLFGSPLRADDKEKMKTYNDSSAAAAKVLQNKHDLNNSIIQNIKSAPPKGSTGPTVPPKPTQGSVHKN